eukprot:NODE_852_length_3540_cov_1.128742.p2 type:complete len:386 gc:universal NODE_852_length_3540_cov_1.128742:350-1507(+)
MYEYLIAIAVLIILLKPKSIHNQMTITKSNNETIYQSIHAKNGLRTGPHQTASSSSSVTSEEPSTMYELLEYAYKHHKSKNLFGFRTLISTLTKDKRQFYKLSDYKWMSMSLFYKRTIAIGKYIRHLLQDKKSKESIPSDPVLMIFASTSVEWQSIAHACFSQSVTISTAYDTLGPSGLAHSLVQTEATILYCTSDQFKVLIECIKETKEHKLKNVIYKRGMSLDDNQFNNLLGELSNLVEVHEYEECVIHGDALDHPVIKPSPDSLACIMYTSGSNSYLFRHRTTKRSLYLTFESFEYCWECCRCHGYHFDFRRCLFGISSTCTYSRISHSNRVNLFWMSNGLWITTYLDSVCDRLQRRFTSITANCILWCSSSMGYNQKDNFS